jgi:hypothetical protein
MNEYLFIDYLKTSSVNQKHVENEERSVKDVEGGGLG